MTRWLLPYLLLASAAHAQLSQPFTVGTTSTPAKINNLFQDLYDRVPSKTFLSDKNGLVPLSGGGTSNFLRADGTWAVPPGTYVLPPSPPHAWSYVLPPRPPHAWSVDYTAAAEPPAASPAWTLNGVDHASASGGVLTITNCGTDTNYYTKTPGTATSGQSLWGYSRAKVQAGCDDDERYIPLLIGVGSKYVYAVMNDGLITIFAGTNTAIAFNTVSGYVDLVLRLGYDGTYSAWVNGTLVASGTGYADTFATVLFGKFNAGVGGDKALYIDRVAYAVANDSGLPN